MNLGSSWEDFLATRSHSFRSTVRRRERTLTKSFELTYRLADDPDRLDADLDTLYRLHAERWGTPRPASSAANEAGCIASLRSRRSPRAGCASGCWSSTASRWRPTTAGAMRARSGSSRAGVIRASSSRASGRPCSPTSFGTRAMTAWRCFGSWRGTRRTSSAGPTRTSRPRPACSARAHSSALQRWRLCGPTRTDRDCGGGRRTAPGRRAFLGELRALARAATVAGDSLHLVQVARCEQSQQRA